MPTTSIRYFDSVLFNYVGLPAPECTLKKECGNYVVIEHNGDVYSCDFFVKPDWRLGNIMQEKIYEMLNSERQIYFGQRKSELPLDCTTCRWLHYCRGGCPKDYFKNTPKLEHNYFCRSFMMFFDHAHNRLKSLADNWIKTNRINQT
jgi:uncharacterized protein